MDNNIKKFLFDIKTSIEAIEEFTQGKKNFFDYRNDKLVKRAVERELMIIGEAIRRVNDLDESLQITDAHKIRGLRNRIVHAYDSVDDPIIWEIVINYLPKLKAEVENYLAA